MDEVGEREKRLNRDNYVRKVCIGKISTLSAKLTTCIIKSNTIITIISFTTTNKTFTIL